jgi:hypothetical protein
MAGFGVGGWGGGWALAEGLGAGLDAEGRRLAGGWQEPVPRRWRSGQEQTLRRSLGWAGAAGWALAEGLGLRSGGWLGAWGGSGC